MCISRSRLVLLALILSGWSILLGTPAMAQTLCIPEAVGVPGNPGPPIWWEPDELYSTTEPTDKDPRWRGALRITHGSGGIGERVAMRALSQEGVESDDYLYLSWKVELENFGSPVQQVLVGIAPDCSSVVEGCDPDDRYVIAVSLNYDSLERIVAGAPDWFQVEVYRFSQATTDDQDEYVRVRAGESLWWLANFRLWFAPADEEKTWTVNMWIPSWGFPEEEPEVPRVLAEIPRDFFMTYAVRVGTRAGASCMTWPREGCGGACMDCDAMRIEGGGMEPVVIAPQVRYWHRFHMGTAGDCARGISLDVADVGILPEDADPLTATLSNKIRRDAENFFIARPENASGADVRPDTIQAVFRLASWGSTPTGETIFDEGDWLDIYEDHSFSKMVMNESAIPHGNKGVLQTEWHPDTQREMCLYDVPGAMSCAGIESKGSHQCILVELRSSQGGYVFTNESVQRNMDFIEMSRRSRRLSSEAVITPRGARPIPGKDSRVMYLEIDMRNLPLDVNPEEYQRMLEDLDQRYAGWEEEQGSFADLARFMPTAIVHVYHETGESDPSDGSPVLDDQASFGYFVQPPRDEIPTGFRLAIDGADEIEPGLYKMEVSDTGTAVVRVRMKALTEDDAELEPGDPDWRSQKHCDTRTEGEDADECESNFEPVPPPVMGEDTGCGGCHGEPADAGRAGRGGLLLLGLAFLGWYGLRRRVHAGRAGR